MSAAATFSLRWKREKEKETKERVVLLLHKLGRVVEQTVQVEVLVSGGDPTTGVWTHRWRSFWTAVAVLFRSVPRADY